jgi:hypothetical protein
VAAAATAAAWPRQDAMKAVHEGARVTMALTWFMLGHVALALQSRSFLTNETQRFFLDLRRRSSLDEVTLYIGT